MFGAQIPMKTLSLIRRVALGLAALVVLASPVAAQTTINSTTTTAAVDNKQQTFPLTSVTGISTGSRNLAGDLLYFEDNSGEVVQVNAVDTTALTVTVTRGVRSTPTAAHLSGVTVFTGPAQRFALSVGFGTCTAANELYLPRIVINRNIVQDCLGGQWAQTNANGIAVVGASMASVAGVLGAFTGTILPVSGTSAITGFTNPKGIAPGFRIAIVPSGIFTWTAATNIALAGTAVVNKLLEFVWSGTKWVPSYIA
jgi:hypothetical protein